MRCAEIRQKFIEYYQNLGFQLLPRAPMLHPSIPMSFVMSAGLVQIETSLARAENRSGNKFVLVQDCFRHFDLNAIGKDNVHLSLFEMPAAFMFEKNGKRKIIPQMWQFATEIIGIDNNRIWVSFFDGGEVAGNQLPSDRLTYRAWREVGVPGNRLIGLNREHNYWVQGGGIQNGGPPSRKCGANTEMFYDLGQEKSCSPDCKPGCRCGRFVEFSNLLFVSHELNPYTHELIPMNDPFTEAVVGTERLAMILQHVPSVFETWNYQPVMETIRQCVTHNNLSDELITQSVRVMADHLRALYILIADGAPPPGKDGRERIIKLLIRAVITRQIILGITGKTFLTKVIRIIVDLLVRDGTLRQFSTEGVMLSYFERENQRFRKTIKQGYRKLERILEENRGQTLDAAQMVFLEKQCGMPYPLIILALQQRQLRVAENEYHIALTEWKQALNNKLNQEE